MFDASFARWIEVAAEARMPKIEYVDFCERVVDGEYDIGCRSRGFGDPYSCTQIASVTATMRCEGKCIAISVDPKNVSPGEGLIMRSGENVFLYCQQSLQRLPCAVHLVLLHFFRRSLGFGFAS